MKKTIPTFESFIKENNEKGIKDGDTVEITGGDDSTLIGKKGKVDRAYSDSVCVIIDNDTNVDGYIYDNNDVKNLNESDDSELGGHFKDKNGKSPKVGDFITDEDGTVGKIKNFHMEDNKSTTNTARMNVDFHSHFAELNPECKFEIIIPDSIMKKAFEDKIDEAAKMLDTMQKVIAELGSRGDTLKDVADVAQFVFKNKDRIGDGKEGSELWDNKVADIIGYYLLDGEEFQKEYAKLSESIDEAGFNREDIYKDTVAKIDDMFGINDVDGEGKAIHMSDLEELIKKYKLDSIQPKYLADVLKEKGWTVEESVQEKEFTDDERKKLADKGFAEPDGSYPIESVEDLANAVKAFGRSKDPEKTKAHIKKRAKALNAENTLPEDWK